MLADLIADPVAADEYTHAAEAVLAHDAEIGLQTDGDIWTLALAPVGGKTVMVFYTFDARAVLLLAIEARD